MSGRKSEDSPARETKPNSSHVSSRSGERNSVDREIEELCQDTDNLRVDNWCETSPLNCPMSANWLFWLKVKLVPRKDMLIIPGFFYILKTLELNWTALELIRINPNLRTVCGRWLYSLRVARSRSWPR